MPRKALGTGARRCVHSWQMLAATRMPCGRWVGTQTAVPPDGGLLFSTNKECAAEPGKAIGEPHIHVGTRPSVDTH